MAFILCVSKFTSSRIVALGKGVELERDNELLLLLLLTQFTFYLSANKHARRVSVTC